MTTVAVVITSVAGLLGLAGLLGGIWATFRLAGQDARIKRLQSENEDYLRRLNYVEPKLEAALQQNELLLALHNPADQIEALKTQEQTNHEQTVTLLQQQQATLVDIDRHLQERKP